MYIGRLLIAAGLTLVGLGVVYMLLVKANLPMGRLPGDLVWRGRRTTVYFPIVTCLILSVVGALVLWLLSKRP